MGDFVKIEIEANTEEAEILMAALSDIDFYAFEQNEKALIAYITQGNFNEEKLKEVLTEDTVYSCTIIENKNWNQEWESQLQPVYINNFAGIRASFHQALHVRHEIIITPKMSFGTGHHPTTYLMIEKMQNINFQNKIVLDFGTGTGVLAILAEKLGASKVFAIDNDEWSINNAMENIQANDCKKITLQNKNDVIGIPQPNIDIIVANINLNVLIKNVNHISTISHTGSILLMSGFLYEDERAILNSFSSIGFVKKGVSQREGWIALTLKKQ